MNKNILGLPVTIGAPQSEANAKDAYIRNFGLRYLKPRDLARERQSLLQASFASSDSFPYKLFACDAARQCLLNQWIRPIHVQLNPTNRCNLSCSFCSCSNRERNETIQLERLLSIVSNLVRLGLKAVTISGGGEPTLYRHLGYVIEFLAGHEIRIGLVTNGAALDRLTQLLDRLTWCRISFSDERCLDRKLANSLRSWRLSAPHTDWSLSYVVTRNFNRQRLIELLEFAKSEGFRHVRVVSDLLDVSSVPDLSVEIADMRKYHEILIYQRRDKPQIGQNPCYLSLLKPSIAADGNLYPCCGVQYALPKASRDFPAAMSMGSDIEALYESQRFFDGSACVRCYYSQYNTAIGTLMGNLAHKEFV